MTSKPVFKYFAFGSNLLSERILIQNPTARFVSVGKLKNYRFQFDTPATFGKDYWNGAIGNIHEASPADYVMGVVWEIDLDHMVNLDRQETHYGAITVDVELSDGRIEKCRTYKINEEVTGICLPDPYYKKVIISGAKQNGLPEEYIKFLQSFEDNKDSTVPIGYLKVLEIRKQQSGKDGLDEFD